MTIEEIREGLSTTLSNEELYSLAHAYGMQAVESAQVQAMTVVDPSTGQSWHVADGPCGFAWINIKPGNSKFANWLKKTDRGRKAYEGGVNIWVYDFGQSIQKKEAYARAFAEALRSQGIRAYAGSRLD